MGTDYLVLAVIIVVILVIAYYLMKNNKSTLVGDVNSCCSGICGKISSGLGQVSCLIACDGGGKYGNFNFAGHCGNPN